MQFELNRVRVESAGTTQKIEQIEEARATREKAREEGMSNKISCCFFAAAMAEVMSIVMAYQSKDVSHRLAHRNKHAGLLGIPAQGLIFN